MEHSVPSSVSRRRRSVTLFENEKTPSASTSDAGLICVASSRANSESHAVIVPFGSGFPRPTKSLPETLSEDNLLAMEDALCTRTVTPLRTRDVASWLLQLASLLLLSFLVIGVSIHSLGAPSVSRRSILQLHVASAAMHHLRVPPPQFPVMYTALLSLDLGSYGGEDPDEVAKLAQRNARDLVVVHHLPAPLLLETLDRALPHHGRIRHASRQTNPTKSVAQEWESLGGVFFREDTWSVLKHGIAHARTNAQCALVNWVRLRRKLHTVNPQLSHPDHPVVTIAIVSLMNCDKPSTPVTCSTPSIHELMHSLSVWKTSQPESGLIVIGDVNDLHDSNSLGLADPLSKFQSCNHTRHPTLLATSSSLPSVSASTLYDSLAMVIVFETTA